MRAYRAWAPIKLPAMPRLTHLNGPPGTGKSVLAQLRAQDHPGVLHLDIDRLRVLVGGWRQRFAETGEILRPLTRGRQLERRSHIQNQATSVRRLI